MKQHVPGDRLINCREMLAFGAGRGVSLGRERKCPIDFYQKTLMSQLSDKTKIAKNSLFLYFRMLLIMLVSLYTVRVVISTLGVQDYGIFSAVGGVVLIMSFLSQTITSASQRFFSYELGRGSNCKQLKRLFSSILIIYFIIGVVIVLIAETFGLWFLYHKMVIPEDRMGAAFWVFQFSLLTFLVTVVSTPYNALIIAHEDMKIFAYVSIVEAILKLVIVYLLLISSFDRLILYAILTFGVACLVRGIYGAICARRYAEAKFTFYWDRSIIKSIFSYSSWTLFGTLAGAANNQGAALLLNMFFGPIANAAQSVAQQVGHALQVFSGNVFTAIRPPLIKSYAEGNYSYMLNLFFISSKFSFYLLYAILLPLMMNTDIILYLWLGDVGEYMVIFTRLMMLYVVIIAIGNPITIIVQAANKVKLYHGLIDGFMLISLPLSYVLYKLSLPAASIFVILVLIAFVAHCFRVVFLHRIIYFPYVDYFKKVLLPSLGVVLFSILLCYYLIPLIHFSGIINLLVTIIFTLCIVALGVYLFGMTLSEKQVVMNFMRKRK